MKGAATALDKIKFVCRASMNYFKIMTFLACSLLMNFERILIELLGKYLIHLWELVIYTKLFVKLQ